MISLSRHYTCILFMTVLNVTNRVIVYVVVLYSTEKHVSGQPSLNCFVGSVAVFVVSTCSRETVLQTVKRSKKKTTKILISQ